MGSNKATIWNAERRDEFLWFDPDKLVIVGLDTKADDSHPLHDSDRTGEVDESLVRNVMVHGVKVPILVRLVGARGAVMGSGVVEVVDGRQRVMAAREANKRLRREGSEPIRVPGLPQKGDDAELLGVMVLTNENRKDDTPLAKAKKAQRLRAAGRSDAEIGVLMGVTSKCVANWTALLSCDGKVQEAVEVGTVPADVAVKLSSMPREEQRETLTEMVAAGATRGRAADSAIKDRKKNGSKSNGHSNTKDEDRIALPGKRELRRLLEALEPGSDGAKVLAFVLDGAPLKGDIRRVWERAVAREGAEA